jgi:hypothetical protein
MSAQKQYWDVVFVHPERQIADHASLPTSLLIPPLPPCLAPVRNFLVEAGITPSHVSSNAGFSQTGGLPSSVFTLTQPEVSNCTACFVVACEKFDPGNSPPEAAIIIEGIERIKLLSQFLGKLIGAIAMSYLRSSFPNPITADMDCAAVINLQDQQSHVPPEQASDQKRLYGALLYIVINIDYMILMSILISVPLLLRFNRGHQQLGKGKRFSTLQNCAVCLVTRKRSS